MSAFLGNAQHRQTASDKDAKEESSQSITSKCINSVRQGHEALGHFVYLNIDMFEWCQYDWTQWN